MTNEDMKKWIGVVVNPPKGSPTTGMPRGRPRLLFEGKLFEGKATTKENSASVVAYRDPDHRFVVTYNYTLRTHIPSGIGDFAGDIDRARFEHLEDAIAHAEACLQNQAADFSNALPDYAIAETDFEDSMAQTIAEALQAHLTKYVEEDDDDAVAKKNMHAQLNHIKGGADPIVYFQDGSSLEIDQMTAGKLVAALNNITKPNDRLAMTQRLAANQESFETAKVELIGKVNEGPEIADPSPATQSGSNEMTKALQKFWLELCSVVQPGSPAGYDAYLSTVESGLPEQPPADVAEKILKAYNDPTIFTPSAQYPNDTQSMIEAVAQGAGSDWFWEHSGYDEDLRDYIQSNYKAVSDWGNYIFGKYIG
jgi:hypothetical protein